MNTFESSNNIIVTASMEHRHSSEARSCLSSQEISHIYGIRIFMPCSQQPTNCPYLELNESRSRPPFSFLKFAFNIIILSRSEFFKCPLVSTSIHHSPVYISLFPIHATCPAHLTPPPPRPILNLIVRITFSEQLESRTISYWNFKTCCFL